MLDLQLNSAVGEDFDWSWLSFDHRGGVVDVVGVAKCIRPKCNLHCCWPSVFCVNQLRSSQVLKVSDLLFGLAILKVGVDSAKTDGLFAVCDGLQESIVGEASIVGVIMLDLNAEGLCVGFIRDLRLHCFIRCYPFLHIGEGVSAEVVNEDSHILVSIAGGLSFQLRTQSWCGGLQLVHRNTLSGCRHRMNLSCVVLAFCMPWNFAKSASGALRDSACC